ncbi:ABC transporter permease [Streptomyces polygonati]|uniref:ABC transporter permease n=1 Tax=Streptomyces polygonati TaxID=1617087 RepID=A0ABV8HHY9_9ACTN
MNSASPTPGPTPFSRFRAELNDAVSVRSVLLVVSVLALQLGFILSYVGAFHSPTPHRISVAVVAPGAQRFADMLNALPGDPLHARVAKDESQARRLILHRSVDSAIVIAPRGTTDRLLLASAGGPAVSETASRIAARVEAVQHRRLTVQDIRPPSPKDGRSLSSFYLALGWVVGGYLAAALLGMSAGARPATFNRTLIRMGVLTAYSILSGLGGAIIVDPALGALPGHFFALWWIGALVVLAAGASTALFQILLGPMGIGLTILLFVVLGNPSAGGPYPAALLPPFWRAIGPWFPPGAATTAIRNTVYFAGNATTVPLLLLGAYAIGGVVLSLLASAIGLRRRGATRTGPPDDPAKGES